MNRSRVLTALLVLVAACSAANAQVGKGLIDVNSASEKELTALPHMTPEIVKLVIDKRPFESITDLNTLLLQQKLTKEQAAEFYEKAFVHINLNTAKKEEILLIPKIAKKMSHEFAEYRPWTIWKQFDKEIGKYVGQAETDRLKQYCFIPMDVNSATEEMLETIPALSADAIKRIMQARPWKSIEDFQKQMVKPTHVKTQEHNELAPSVEVSLTEKDAKRVARYLVAEKAAKK